MIDIKNIEWVENFGRYKLTIERVVWISPRAEQQIKKLVNSLACELESVVRELSAYGSEYPELDETVKALKETNAGNAVNELENAADCVEDARNNASGFFEDQTLIYFVEILRSARMLIITDLLLKKDSSFDDTGQ